MDVIGALDLTSAFHDRGIDLESLGVAYLYFLGTVALTAGLFVAARAHLVVAPNRFTRDYAEYVTTVLATLLVATVLENELVPGQEPSLVYVAFPQLLLLMMLHVWIGYRQEPWLIELGASAVLASLIVAGIGLTIASSVQIAHIATFAVFVGLVVFLWLKAVSTKRGFMKASSIYITSKESFDPSDPPPQKPWVGWLQWGGLVAASVLLAILNSMLRGSGLDQIPAVDVALQSTLLILVTVLVCAVPALAYWIARKTWMPELTRFAWLVWFVVGFAFVYGNYLSSLNRV
jgi:hypothetical protein